VGRYARIIDGVYSSLRKIDIVAEHEGKPLLVQTDHRSADEVASEIEISVLFALARTLGPKQSEHGHGTLRYVAMGGLHPKLATVLASVGAECEAEGVMVDLSDVARASPADLADGAFRGLAEKALAREGLTADEAGLAAFEATCDRSVTEEDDEIAYWTCVAELAAVTGEALRAVHGGRWVQDAKHWADIPFVFQAQGDTATMNPVGKAVKFLRHGAAESPCQLFRAMEDRGAPQGPLVPNLKPSRWDLRDQVVCEPLREDLLKADVDIPIIAYGNDFPHTFAMLFRDGTREKAMASLREQATANLAAVDVEVEPIELSQLSFWAVQGSFFAAEKILDAPFLRTMHTLIRASLLVASIPEKGKLLLASGLQPAALPGFMAITRGIFEKNEGGRHISPTVFLISDGQIVGVASAGSNEPPEPPPKKGFFARLFN
jgi:hypothetical protein